MSYFRPDLKCYEANMEQEKAVSNSGQTPQIIIGKPVWMAAQM